MQNVALTYQFVLLVKLELASSRIILWDDYYFYTEAKNVAFDEFSIWINFETACMYAFKIWLKLWQKKRL